MIWVNFITTSLFSRTLEIMVNQGNHPQMAELFRLVKNYWLVKYYCHILGMSSSQLTNSYFSDGVGIPLTRLRPLPRWHDDMMTIQSIPIIGWLDLDPRTASISCSRSWRWPDGKGSKSGEKTWEHWEIHGNSWKFPINMFYFFHSVGNFIIPTDFHSIIFQRGTMWGPPVISGFRFAPVTIVISTINHSYWSYKPT